MDVKEIVSKSFVVVVVFLVAFYGAFNSCGAWVSFNSCLLLHFVGFCCMLLCFLCVLLKHLAFCCIFPGSLLHVDVVFLFLAISFSIIFCWSILCCIMFNCCIVSVVGSRLTSAFCCILPGSLLRIIVVFFRFFLAFYKYIPGIYIIMLFINIYQAYILFVCFVIACYVLLCCVLHIRPYRYVFL